LTHEAHAAWDERFRQHRKLRSSSTGEGYEWRFEFACRFLQDAMNYAREDCQAMQARFSNAGYASPKEWQAFERTTGIL
jgi:hypothetical protein